MIALALTFAMISHMCGSITIYICVWDLCMHSHLRMSTGGQGRFVLLFIFSKTIFLHALFKFSSINFIAIKKVKTTSHVTGPLFATSFTLHNHCMLFCIVCY